MTQRTFIVTQADHVGRMPNQVFGTIDGRAFYFRARWGEWCLYADADANRTVLADGGGEVINGEQPGWWSGEDTLAFVRALLERVSR